MPRGSRSFPGSAASALTPEDISARLHYAARRLNHPVLAA
ncbi:hypothetical protein BH23GEM7_BH23GEM7_30640 [soil metagenome]